MITWTPIFSTLVDSSLWDEPDYVCKVFITMLAIKDFRDHIVRTTAYGLARKCWPRDEGGLDRVEDALKRLEAPDPKRPGQPYEGRRVEKVADGWLVLNGEVYQAQIRQWQRRAYKTEKEAEYRQRRKRPVAGLSAEQRLAARRDGARAAIQDGFEESDRRAGGGPVSSSSAACEEVKMDKAEANGCPAELPHSDPGPGSIPEDELPPGFG